MTRVVAVVFAVAIAAAAAAPAQAGRAALGTNGADLAGTTALAPVLVLGIELPR